MLFLELLSSLEKILYSMIDSTKNIIDELVIKKIQK